MKQFYDPGSDTRGGSGAHEPAGRKYGFQGGTGIEFVGDEGGSTLQVGPVTVPGVYEYREAGGQNAPTHRTEEGYEFTTRVDAEPVEIYLSAWVRPETLQALRNLRNRSEPYPASFKSMRLPTCTLEGLDVHEQGETAGAIRVDISIREIQQGRTEKTQLVVLTQTGGKSTNPSGYENPEQPSYAEDSPGEPTDKLKERKKRLFVWPWNFKRKKDEEQ